MTDLQTPSASATAPPPVDILALRKTLGQFATGVTVIATRTEAQVLVGLTVNSFAALSLQPPLVTWALRLNSPSLDVFLTARYFVVNVLAEEQVEVSRRFAQPGPDKFAGVPVANGMHGLPLVHGAAAWLQCRSVAHHTHGDHVLFVGEVQQFDSSGAPPLVFHGGGYHVLGSRL
ncbi:MAG: hypothetical protein RLZZ126_1924 [Pseudomonadota bacterium]|jgi:flavin reductase (DIM6/NTAB) family NADH-FMN oxidoreductase RutF